MSIEPLHLPAILGRRHQAAQLAGTFGSNAHTPAERSFFSWATSGLKLDWNEAVPTLQAPPSRPNSPLVTWAVVSSLNNHNWLNRVAEYLQDDPNNTLPGRTEMILLFTQNILTVAAAHRRIEQWVASQKQFKSNRHLEEKSKTIRVVQDLRLGKHFNISWSRLRLIQEARGEFLFFRDADTRCTGANVTELALRTILDSKVAVLGFPSSRNHKPFKPYAWEPQEKHEALFPGVTLVNTVAGMATFSPTSLERLFLKNPALVGFGEFLAFCTKVVRGGYALGYVDSKVPILSTDDADIAVPHLSGTRDKIPPEKLICLRLIADYYDRDLTEPRFRRELERSYALDLTTLSPEIEAEVKRRTTTFELFQRSTTEPCKIGPSLGRFYSHDTPEYLDVAKAQGATLYRPIIKDLARTKKGRQWLKGH